MSAPGLQPPIGLPARVERAIAAAQDRSERLIGWAQLALALFFGLLYALSPPPQGRVFDPMTWMPMTDLPEAVLYVVGHFLAEPVPWVLGVYLGATAIRLVWSYRARLPDWSLVGSILIDMALLFTLIWSFHIQYGQPPAFYLKAPTILYVFVFIALRALRLEEKYVLLSGAAAAAGWLMLVLYAASYDQGGAPVTRNYVEYLSRPVILWGAEIDKVVAFLVVAGILAMAARTGRRLLARAASEGEASRDLQRFLPAEAVRAIIAADERIEAGQGRVSQAAIMFVDLRDFTGHARRLGPDLAVALLAEYHARIGPVVRRHGGSVDKLLGDGVMISFGALRPAPDYAAAALNAACDLAGVAAQWSAERAQAGLAAVRMGVGVASGPMLVGAVGEDNRLDYTMIGDAVNLAAKLEKQTKAEGAWALTDAATYELACQQGFAPPPVARRSQVQVAGLATAIDLVVLA